MSSLHPTRSYSETLQTILDTYSGSYDSLNETRKELDVRKAELKRTLRNPMQLTAMSEKQKDTLMNDFLVAYHTFVKTQEFVKNFFERAKTVFKEYNLEPISEETYKKMTILGENPERLLRKEKALQTVNKHLCSLLSKFEESYISLASQDIPQVISRIDQLANSLFPKLAQDKFLSGAPAPLEQLYNAWKKTVDEDVRDWTPLVADSTLEATFQEGYSELNEALAALNLTYVDPETKIGYGINSNSEKDLCSASDRTFGTFGRV